MVKETLGDRWLTPDLFRFGASSLVTDLTLQMRGWSMAATRVQTTLHLLEGEA